MFRIGLIINPFSGLGGAVGLKGSDGLKTRELALAKGAEPRARARTMEALSIISAYSKQLTWLTAGGEMGEAVLNEAGFNYEVVYTAPGQQTEAEDTTQAVTRMASQGVDLIVFSGGDGTARDVFSVIADRIPVVGIPTGVKIHSGVYAVSPKAAGRILEQLISGQLTSVRHGDVMDIDEEAFRRGQVRAKRYGEMLVPGQLEYIQAVKMGGKEHDELVLTDIADDIIERMEDDALYIMGSGSTVDAIMESLDLPNTLLGVDAVVNQELIGTDLSAKELQDLLAEYQQAYLIITLIGGQGHIFGRGNQQLSPDVIRKVGRDNIIVVATKAKLNALDGRPLQVDTGDSALDTELSGFIQVTTGYRDQTMLAIQKID